MQKSRRVTSPCCNVVLETMPVMLYGRFHPALNLYEGDLLSGSWTLWVSRVEGVQGFLRGSWLQRSNESKISTISRVLGFQGPRVNGSQGLNGFKGTKGPRVSGFQGIEGFPLVSRALKRVDISKIQKFQGSRDEGFQGFKVQRLEGERAPRFS